jgi:hypothetical protein
MRRALAFTLLVLATCSALVACAKAPTRDGAGTTVPRASSVSVRRSAVDSSSVAAKKLPVARRGRVTGSTYEEIERWLGAKGISALNHGKLGMVWQSDDQHVRVTGKMLWAPGQPGVEFKHLSEVDVARTDGYWALEKTK